MHRRGRKFENQTKPDTIPARTRITYLINLGSIRFSYRLEMYWLLWVLTYQYLEAFELNTTVYLLSNRVPALVMITGNGASFEALRIKHVLHSVLLLNPHSWRRDLPLTSTQFEFEQVPSRSSPNLTE